MKRLIRNDYKWVECSFAAQIGFMTPKEYIRQLPSSDNLGKLSMGLKGVFPLAASSFTPDYAVPMAKSFVLLSCVDKILQDHFQKNFGVNLESSLEIVKPTQRCGH